MEKIKAIKMVIARYRADAAALVRREEDLMKQIELIENLIPTVTIWYMSIAVQATDMMIPQPEVEEAREKLEQLKRSLKEHQQTIEMIREEEIIVNKRIEELEIFLGEKTDPYRPTYVIGNDMQRSERPGISYEEETEDLKIEGFGSQSEKFEARVENEATNLKQYTSVYSVNKDTSEYPADKDISEFSVNKDTLEYSADKDTSEYSVNKDTSEYSVNKDTSEYSVKKDTSEYSVNKDTSEYSANKYTSEYSAHKDASEYSVNKDTLEYSVNKDTSVSTNVGNATSKPGKPDILRNSRQRADMTHEKERDDLQIEGLEDQIVKFDELIQAEDTDWKKVCEDLSYQVSKLSENLENSSRQLRESESYVKHLEEECSNLEKELQDKIQLLKQRTPAYKEQERSSQKDLENEEALWAMHEALEKTRSMKEVLTISTKLSTMGEGEGITPAYMQLAHWRFALKLPEYQGDRELKEKLMNGIKQGNMAPYYKEVCADLGWEFDGKLYDEMAAANVKRLEELEKEHENNVMDEEDQSQLCGVWQSKLDYLCSIGDRDNASTLANSKVDDKTVPKSHRIDAVFSLFRISFFHGCNIKGMSTAIEKATELIEGISGGDWSARNKLKAYEGVWSLAIRDFTRAAHLFVDVVPTFESYELADFGTIIRYTVLSCMIALPRCDLRKKLMLHGVMAQALHSQYQDLREYFVSLYDGRYSDFLVCLARIEVEMKRDPLLHPHYRHYVQEMRLRAYKQILQAYRSLSLDYMAQSFGVTSEFIEREVARFAAAGRLQCKIDSVAGTVITSAHLDDSVRSKEAPEASLDRNILYQTTVKRGDILLNRLKKLARVMDF